MISSVANLVVMYDDHVQSCVSISVFQVDVSVLGAQQSHALLLTETSGKAQRVFAPVCVPAQRKQIITFDSRQYSFRFRLTPCLFVRKIIRESMDVLGPHFQRRLTVDCRATLKLCTCVPFDVIELTKLCPVIQRG